MQSVLALRRRSSFSLKCSQTSVACQFLDRLNPTRRAARPQIAAIDGLLQRRVIGIAVALGPFARDAKIELVADDGNIQHAFETAIVVIADIDGRHRFILIGRFGRNHVDDARRCVAAVERALRPAQHFHLADVDRIPARRNDCA